MNSKVSYQVVFALGIIWSVAACEHQPHLGSLEIFEPDGSITEVRVHCARKQEISEKELWLSWTLQVAHTEYQLRMHAQQNQTTLYVIDDEDSLVALAWHSHSANSILYNGSNTAIFWSSPQVPLSPDERSRFDSHALALLDRDVISKLAQMAVIGFEGDLELANVNAFVNGKFEITSGDTTACDSACGACCTNTNQSYCCTTSLVQMTTRNDEPECRCSDEGDE